MTMLQRPKGTRIKPPTPTGSATPDTPDAELLRDLGYHPVLARRMSAFGNFAISFSVISVLSGCMTLFGYGMNTGGPRIMIWGWIGVGAMTMLIGLGLAEVTSAYPTAGGLFYMAARLGGKHAKAWGWTTGWLNLLGLLGAIAGIDYGAAQFLGALAGMRYGFVPTKWSLLGIYACFLTIHAVLNMLGVRVLDLFNRVSVWWHLLGVAVIVAVLAAVPTHHQSLHWVLTHYANSTGITVPLYVGAIGLLMAGYTFSGYDASAHLSEETTRAAVSAPRGIVKAIWVSWAAGLVLIAGILYAVRDYDAESSAAVPPAQIFRDSLGDTKAEALLAVALGAMLCCGLAATAACSRMIFAFNRDGALPGSKLWSRTNSNEVPSNAVVLAVAVAFVLALPSLWNPAAYGAVTAINVVGITPAYAIPIYLRVRQGSRFTPGAWSLGRWGVPVGIAAVSWVVLETILFCLPQAWPMTATNFNYAPAALGAALILAWVWWLVRGRSARYGTPTTAAIEEDRFADMDAI